MNKQSILLAGCVALLTVTHAIAEQQSTLVTFDESFQPPVLPDVPAAPPPTPRNFAPPPRLNLPNPIPAPNLRLPDPNSGFPLQPGMMPAPHPQWQRPHAPLSTLAPPRLDSATPTINNTPTPPQKAPKRFDFEMFERSIQAELERTKRLATEPAPAHTQGNQAALRDWQQSQQSLVGEHLEQIIQLQNSLQQTLQQSQQKYEELNTNYQALLRERDQLRLQQQDQQKQQFNTQLIQQDLDKLSKDYDSLQMSLNTSNQQLEIAKSAELQLQELTAEHASLQEQLRVLTAENQQINAAIAALELEKQALQGSLDQLGAEKAALNQTQTQASDELEALRQQINQLNTERDNLGAQLQDALTELNGATARIGEIEQGIAELDAARASAETARGRMVELEQALSQSQKEAAGAGQMRADMETAQARVAQLEQELQTTKTESDASLLKLTESTSLISNLQAAVESAKAAAVPAADLGALQTELEQNQSRLIALEEEKLTLSAQLQQLEAGAVETSARLTAMDAMSTELDEKKAELESLRSQCESCSAELDAVKDLLATSGAEALDLRTRLNALKVSLEESEAGRAQAELLSRDSDADGVNDANDQCPDSGKGAVVDALGCENDSDGDGVVDRLDLCPETPKGSSVDQLGCVAGAPITLRGLNFQTGSAEFTAESMTVLDSLLDIMDRFPELRLQVVGHTDNTGERETNISLSNQRAVAVKNHLVDKGVAAERLESIGIGPDQPVADNNTSSGRAANRRVELRKL